MQQMEGTGTETGVRIFVGGLGESVKVDELCNIFGSLGRIEGSVEIIRTKGRSFAYCDFFPFSQNSLAKLFSTYNGCVWKGGRLKLERAKEHFLVRLRREWAEDSSLSCQQVNAIDVADKVTASAEVLDKLSNPSNQIRIFFPSLRKVKALPLKGTGKHKYSFQRVQVPLFPKHFCDCEEHSDPAEPFKKQSCVLESLNGGISIEEIGMMESVMNKIFKRGMDSEIVGNENNSLSMEEDAANSDKMQDGNIEEDLAEDDDNLVTNIVRTSKTTTPGTRKVSRFDKTEISKDGSKSLLKAERSRMTHGKNNTSFSEDHDGTRDELLSSTSGKADDLQINVSRMALGMQPAEPNRLETRSTWTQKSSWKELVGNRSNSAFTVSHVLADAPVKEGQLMSGNAGELSSVGSKDHDLVEQDHVNRNHQSRKSLKLEDSGGIKSPVLEDSVGVNSTKLEDSRGVESPKLEDSTVVATRTSDAAKSGRGASWLHKSSWTELVAANPERSFSVSQIWSTQKQGTEGDTVVTTANSILQNELPSKAFVEMPSPCQTGTICLVKEKDHDTVRSTPEPDPLTREGNSKVSTETVVGESEVCPFMRSSASLKDWFNSKAALTGSRKRKK